MKILEVLDCYYPKFDGPTQVVTNYCNNLIRNGENEVEVLVPKFKNYVDNQKFRVNRVLSMNGPEGYRVALPFFDRKIKKYLKSKKFDVIHVHSPFTLGRFAIKFGKKHNIPTIFTFHTKFKEDIERTTKIRLFQKIAMNYIMKTINLADYVLTVSDGAGDCLRDYGYKKNIDVIRNGTDLIYEQDDKSIKEINEKYNLSDLKHVFLSVGRIVENKKLDFALDVMKCVKNRGYKFKYVVVGSGNYETQLKQRCSELGLDDCVLFTGKIMDRKLLSAMYKRSSLFIFPSTFDTASLAPIEAASQKLPTLMTKGCSTAEIITDNVNGLLAEQDVEKWADKVVAAIEDEQFLTSLKEKAYREVYRTWGSVVDEVSEYYKSRIKG